MRICFYTPFKPLDHPRPSGDQVMARALRDYLGGEGHAIRLISRPRARWIYHRPGALCQALVQYLRLRLDLPRWRPHCFVTYHCYYKAPDLLGPGLSRALDIPYIIFQGAYSTRVRRSLSTWPGYHLNRRALLAARLVIDNRLEDVRNLARLLPEERIAYVRPGIHVQDFQPDARARAALRREWGAGDRPVLLAAAMFRNDVKTRGLEFVLHSCARLAARGLDFLLVLAGDGVMRAHLEDLAARLLPGRVRFTGQVERGLMHRCYSAADLFVFPGFNESLGMVYLEAQCCGLPVVAFREGGIPEVVRHGETGLLCPTGDEEAWDRAVMELLRQEERRRALGKAARAHVRARHDARRNLARGAALLRAAVEEKP